MYKTKWVVPALTPFILGGIFGSVALAQTGKTPDGGSVSLRVQKASDLIGKPVMNPAGERLGEVQDLAVDPERGRIVYAVLSFGGFMGMGEKWFAIPTGALTLPSHCEHYVLAVEKDRLKNATGFDKGQWPNMGNPTWASETHTYYGQKPYWSTTGTETPPLRIQKASDLIGKKVVNLQGENLGDIHNIAIDPDRGRVAYAVLSFGGFLGMGDKWFAIPWGAFELPTDSRHLVLRMEKDKLKASQGFDKDRWPDLTNLEWAGGIHSQYGFKPYWNDVCPGCGLAVASWTDTLGFTNDKGMAYCCRGCAQGDACTCTRSASAKTTQTDSCPGCGMKATSWASSAGFANDKGVKYCCKGCVQGSGCTCKSKGH